MPVQPECLINQYFTCFSGGQTVAPRLSVLRYSNYVCLFVTMLFFVFAVFWVGFKLTVVFIGNFVK